MAKYNIKKAKKLKFARYGGLSSVNQLGYDSKSTDFHGPPARRGFYCFVWPYIELFLLGANCTKDPKTIGAKFTYVRDKDGNIIDDNHIDYEYMCRRNKLWSTETSEYVNFCKDNDSLINSDYDAYIKLRDDKFGPGKLSKWVLVEKPKPRLFEYDGVLWHHLGAHLKQHLILDTKGSWVKTEIISYRYALEIEMHKSHQDMMKWHYKEVDDKYKILLTKEMALRRGTKDHLECFIEKL